MRTYQRRSQMPFAGVVAVALQLGFGLCTVSARTTQDHPAKEALTPIQREIERQRQGLSSAEIEDRREALVVLRSLRHPEASRVALSALNDPAPIVRATAAASVLWLPAEESTESLIPLLSDKDEFVRQQTAYALGQTGSHAGVAPLIERLADKKASVRGAAAVALGHIGDAAAVTSLAAVLNPQAGLTRPKKGQEGKREQNPFVLRAAARSLGQIGNRAGVPALIITLQNDEVEDDVRREAAFALGLIGDASAIPALRQALTARDPYLAEAAHKALRMISRSQLAVGI